jgi:hypothetical protein
VRNTYATYLYQGDSSEKSGLIPHNVAERHLSATKAPADKDRHAGH